MSRDERAFLALYDRFAPGVYTLTLRILGDSMVAEEATRDTFLKLRAVQDSSFPDMGNSCILAVDDAYRTALDRLRRVDLARSNKILPSVISRSIAISPQVDEEG